MCIGCGVCAGTCPSSLLTMGWRSNGDLAVDINGACPPKCDVCLTVCPFVSENPDEDILSEDRFGSECFKRDPVLGHFTETYVGYAKRDSDRLSSASGGLLTEVLKGLLEQKEVDVVYCVGAGTTSDRLFEFRAVVDPEELDTTRGSRYYPVDVGGVMSELQAVIERWTPSFRQLSGQIKVKSGFIDQAASGCDEVGQSPGLGAAPTLYASSGVRSSSDECGRRVL